MSNIKRALEREAERRGIDADELAEAIATTPEFLDEIAEGPCVNEHTVPASLIDELRGLIERAEDMRKTEHDGPFLSGFLCGLEAALSFVRVHDEVRRAREVPL
jgi:hypothetical protein